MAVAVVGAHTLEIWLRLQLAVAVADCGCGWKLRLQIAVPIHGEFNGGCGCWSPYTGNLVAVTACGCRLRLEIAVVYGPFRIAFHLFLHHTNPLMATLSIWRHFTVPQSRPAQAHEEPTLLTSPKHSKPLQVDSWLSYACFLLPMEVVKHRALYYIYVCVYNTGIMYNNYNF